MKWLAGWAAAPESGGSPRASWARPSGLALAVRPAGSAQASGSAARRGRVRPAANPKVRDFRPERASHQGYPGLRRSFHAGGRPAHAQIGHRSGCPLVTADARSFPPVLARARIWHGCGHRDRRQRTAPPRRPGNAASEVRCRPGSVSSLSLRHTGQAATSIFPPAACRYSRQARREQAAHRTPGFQSSLRRAPTVSGEEWVHTRWEKPSHCR